MNYLSLKNDPLKLMNCALRARDVTFSQQQRFKRSVLLFLYIAENQRMQQSSCCYFWKQRNATQCKSLHRLKECVLAHVRNNGPRSMQLRRKQTVCMYVYAYCRVCGTSIRPNLQGERYLFTLVSNACVTITAKITRDNKGGDELCSSGPSTMLHC